MLDSKHIYNEALCMCRCECVHGQSADTVQTVARAVTRAHVHTLTHECEHIHTHTVEPNMSSQTALWTNLLLVHAAVLL